MDGKAIVEGLNYSECPHTKTHPSKTHPFSGIYCKLCIADAIDAAFAAKDAEIASRRNEACLLRSYLDAANRLLTHAGILKAQEEHNQLRADLRAVVEALNTLLNESWCAGRNMNLAIMDCKAVLARPGVIALVSPCTPATDSV